jgi:hypothetical protein
MFSNIMYRILYCVINNTMYIFLSSLVVFRWLGSILIFGLWCRGDGGGTALFGFTFTLGSVYQTFSLG